MRISPNRGVKEYTREELARGAVINHAGIKVGFNAKANEVVVLDQNGQGKGGALHASTYKVDQGSWSIVNSKLPSREEPSPLVMKPALNQ